MERDVSDDRASRSFGVGRDPRSHRLASGQEGLDVAIREERWVAVGVVDGADDLAQAVTMTCSAFLDVHRTHPY
ncbi:MAG: hypothetical protein ACRBI6_17525 [Acidimicrobiales bacterium]